MDLPVLRRDTENLKGKQSGVVDLERILAKAHRPGSRAPPLSFGETCECVHVCTPHHRTPLRLHVCLLSLALSLGHWIFQCPQTAMNPTATLGPLDMFQRGSSPQSCICPHLLHGAPAPTVCDRASLRGSCALGSSADFLHPLLPHPCPQTNLTKSNQ